MLRFSLVMYFSKISVSHSRLLSIFSQQSDRHKHGITIKYIVCFLNIVLVTSKC